MKERLRLPTEPLIDGLAGMGPRTALRFDDDDDDDDSFQFRSLFGTGRFRWEDIDGEFVASGSILGFDSTPSALTDARPWTRWSYNISKALAGTHRQIRAIVFGRSPLALAALLNDQRTRRLRLHQTT